LSGLLFSYETAPSKVICRNSLTVKLTRRIRNRLLGIILGPIAIVALCYAKETQPTKSTFLESHVSSLIKSTK